MRGEKRKIITDAEEEKVFMNLQFHEKLKLGSPRCDAAKSSSLLLLRSTSSYLAKLSTSKPNE